MEESHSSRTSDAAATRKRRSSILKSQRVARAPLSELEFTVATPTDTAKSRRVSFSRRTGVAEFVTNEATTTWKNFYEEHNKTLESSGNDSEVKVPRPSVGHLSKGHFNQQFLEIEALQFDVINNDPETSITNAKLNRSECTDDFRLSAPQHNLEFSMFNDPQSKLFGDDLSITGLGQVTDKINVDFSTMQQIGDDLDEIQKDLQQANENNFAFPGPRPDRNVSEYIEVDLNVTHAALRGDESDMSITDTIHSPKVNVSKSNISGQAEKSISKDWAADKENIVLNPYIAPKESATFAINEEPDKVLVFDGKRLTVQSENEPMNYRKTLLPNSQPEKRSQNSTIVLNINDDLPNFIDTLPGSSSFHSKSSNKTLVGDEGNLSITQPLMLNIEPNLCDQRTFYEHDTGNISITQALPTNILFEKEKRKTILFDTESADISVTQAVPLNILPENNDKSRTIVFDTESADISVTQAVLSNILRENKEKRRTIVFDADSADISVTQAVPTNILPENKEKRRTIVFDSESADISVTQAVPSNILQQNKEKRRTIVFDTESADLSVTQAVPSNILTQNREKRRTIVFDSDSADISVTQAVPTNILPEKKEKRRTIVFDSESADISVTQAVPSNILQHSKEKRRTIVFDTESADLSVTQAVLSNILTENKEKSRTIVFDAESADISITQAIPINLAESHLPRKKSFSKDGKITDKTEYGSDVRNISITQSLTSALVLLDNINKTVFNNDDVENMSITQAVPTNAESKKRQTIVFNNEEASNISIMQAVPKQLIVSERSTFDNLNTTRKSLKNSDKFLDDMQDTMEQRNERTQRIIAYDENADMSVNQALPLHIIPEKRKSVVNNNGNLSITQAVPANLILSAMNVEKSETIVCEEDGDISMTQVIPNAIKESDFNGSENLVNESDYEMSVTKSIPINIVKPKISVVQESTLDISMTDVEPANAKYEANGLIEKTEKEVRESSNNSSTTTITKETASDYNEADVSMTPSDDMIEDTQTKDIQKMSFAISECLQRTRTSIKPIPQDIMSLQKDIMDNVNTLNVDTSRIQDVLVYQTSAHADTKPNILEYSLSEVSTTPGPTDVDSKKTSDSDGNTVNEPELIKEPDLNPDAPPSTSNIVKSQTNTSEIGYGLLDSPSAVNKIQNNIQNTILDDLLDMNEDPDGDGIDDKAITAKVSQHSIKPVKCETEESSDSLFYITRDSTDDTEQTDKSDDENSNLVKNPANHSPKTVDEPNSPLQVELEHCIEDLEKKLLQVQQYSSGSRSPTRNRHFEKVLSSDLESLNSDYRGKTIKDANNTRDLLDMLSKFTDKEEQEDPIELVVSRKVIAVENKAAGLESRRLSAVPRRQSVMLSREDLMNNISMAHAVLQQTCGIDPDSDIENPSSQEKSPSPKKGVRLSAEVVKTLRFEDDDSITEVSSAKFEGIVSPLKKTAFGETSYMADEKRNDSRPRVIPSHLKDVSDGLKELMSDLVKPMADVLPFDTSGGHSNELKKNASTCSTQIQANLITSSQIDLDPETHSNPESVITSGIKRLKGIIKPYFNASSDAASPSDRSFEFDKLEEMSEKTSETSSRVAEVASYGKMAQLVSNRFGDNPGRAIDQSTPGPVITFDPNNPLNNVLIAPMDLNDAHSYQPAQYVPPSAVRSPETSHVLHPAPPQVTFKDIDTEASERIANHYDVMTAIPVNSQIDNRLSSKCHGAVIPEFNTQSNEIDSKGPSENTNSFCDVRRQSSVDRAVETLRSRVKDEEVNTVIVMKDNKKLLEANSSLTLVDDASLVGPFCGHLDSGTSKGVSPSSSSDGCKFEVMYAQPNTLDSATNCDVEIVESYKARNNKRKLPDKHKNCTLSSLEKTPKPTSKLAKRSLSPHAGCHHVSKHHSEDHTQKNGSKVSSNLSPKESQTKEKSPKRKTSPKIKTGTNVTVQRVLIEHKDEVLDAQLVKAIDKSVAEYKASKILETVGSLHSARSKDLKDMGDAQRLESYKDKKESPPMDWQPELSTELISKTLPKCEEDVDVLAKIEKLSFVGMNRECEWESKTEDSWSFRLMRGRVRLGVRLARGGLVRGDTAVRDVTVEPVDLGPMTGQKSTIVAVCVRLAAEAMRRASRDVAAAGGVPALLRRAAGVGRGAARWARAMYEAYVQLAYTLTPDGVLTLKVANIPLRSVWEVTMSLELERDAAVPWPRAGAVSVSAVVSDVTVSAEEVRRVTCRVPHDWGHAPRTLWKIFKYLKNRTMDDYHLLGI